MDGPRTVESLQAQLAKEQEANRVLAARLHALKTAATVPHARLSQLVGHELEALAWRRIALGALRSGRGLPDALRGEALLQELLQGEGGALAIFARSASLWEWLSASDLGSSLGAAAAPQLPLAQPAAAAPLIDCLLVCGASHAALLELWRSSPAFL